MNRATGLNLTGVAVAGALAFGLLRPHTAVSRPSKHGTIPLGKANMDPWARPETARVEYESFVARNAASRDRKVQDQVSAARMRLGYLAAKRGEFTVARATFLTAAKSKGTDAMGAFGTVSDGAAYQAVVCLAAAGNRGEAWVRGVRARAAAQPPRPCRLPPPRTPERR